MGPPVGQESAEPRPCPRISTLRPQLLLGGLGGGLSQKAIELLLQEHAVTHLVICGRRGEDAHVAVAEAAAAACGAEVHVASLVPLEPAELPGLLAAAGAFLAGALEDELNNVLVACSKGASRSVAVVLRHLISREGLSLEEAFRKVAAVRWRLWPSALLVEALLGLESHGEKERTCRALGAHAAWATALHNGAEASMAAAEAAWDAAKAAGGSLEEVFAGCKRRVLGLRAGDMEGFQGEAGPGHAEVSEVAEGLLLCGLGGLSPAAVGRLLADHGVRRCLIAGRPGKDRHVAALREAAGAAGMPADAVCIVPVADSAGEDLLGHMERAHAFLQGEGRALVACRQGASRSVSLLLAHLMELRGCGLLEAFRQLAERRWRLWPNAGFVRQLLDREDRLRAKLARPPLTAAQRAEAVKVLGVHAAWAANRQNLEETGAGRQGLRVCDVEGLWQEAAKAASSPEELFEKCKALALGVDLSAFQELPAAQKRART